MAKKIEGNHTLGPEELKILAKASKDPYFFSTFVWVVNPVLGRVQFNLYPYQRAVLYQFMKSRFNIILKCRQMGITELISLYCLWLTMFHANKTVNIISIKDTIAKKVLRRIKFMYKNLPWYLQTPIINGRPGEFGSATEIQFSNGSVIESIPTSEQAGRSESLSLLVIDEAAAVRWANQIWAAALPTLSTGGSAIINSCVTGDTEIVTRNGLLRIDTVCPKEFGVADISALNLEVLTHNLQWKKVKASVNKGKLPTWEIKTTKGTILKCTPAHKLLTTYGWKPVKEIVEKNLNVIEYDLGLDSLRKLPVTKPPKKEELKQIKGYPNYYISNLGKVYIKKGNQLVIKEGRPNKQGYLRIKLWNHKQHKNFSVHRLVVEHFIGKIPNGYVVDHLNGNKNNNYVTNLEIVSVSENTRRASVSNYSMSIGSRIFKEGDRIPIEVVGIVKEVYPKVKHRKCSGSNGNGYQKDIVDEVRRRTGFELDTKQIYKIISGTRNQGLTLSKVEVLRKFEAEIFDISVEDDQSYFVNPSLPSHNTPLGVGGFYHKNWVEAVQGTNGINPIRLYWNMHPDRDMAWYEEMSKALGPKRTAQEIDGDFLSSGNTVFDPADIKAIEECLSDYPVISTKLQGAYREFEVPDPNKHYFIGADCATGRGTDYSSFTCMDRDGDEAACFKGKIPLDKYARFLGDTGQYYNYATLAPETNDIGIAVTLALQDEGYPNLYYSTKLLKEKHKGKPKEEKVPGWLTTTKNRSVIIEALEEDIRRDNIIIKDPFFVQEAYTFIYDAQGRPVALGKHSRNSTIEEDEDGQAYSDDNIFGKAITNHIRKKPTSTVSILPQ